IERQTWSNTLSRSSRVLATPEAGARVSACGPARDCERASGGRRLSSEEKRRRSESNACNDLRAMDITGYGTRTIERRINTRSATGISEIRAFYRRLFWDQDFTQAAPDAFYLFWACSLGSDNLREGAAEIISHKRPNCYILSVASCRFES